MITLTKELTKCVLKRKLMINTDMLEYYDQSFTVRMHLPEKVRAVGEN